MSETLSPSALGRDGANPHISTGELNEAATELVLRHGAMIMRDALKHSATSEDADDAYQRALEILLTKAPSTDPGELVPWLRVVVRNEALDISRARARSASDTIESIEETMEADGASPVELVERSEAAGTGAEALERLTHDQVHCLLAYAHGHSYGEITDITGFTARKVTRCVIDGRRAFTTHFAAIESGSECERLEPVLQRMADGDSFAHVEARPHLRNCAGCRATLRAYREAPSRVAVLFPLPLVAAATAAPTDALPGILDQLGGVWSGLVDRANVHVTTIQQWFEVGTAKKLGAVTATAAVLTAGGVSADRIGVLDRSDATPAATSAAAPIARAPRSLLDEIKFKEVTAAKRKRRQAPESQTQSAAPVAQPERPAPRPAPAAPIDDGSSEFLPEAR